MLLPLLSRLSNPISSETCWELITQGARVIDVRSAIEYAVMHLPQAENVPLETFKSWMPVQDKSEVIVLYCGAGIRSRQACEQLKANGFDCVINGGSLNDLMSTIPADCAKNFSLSIH
ncbi:rhodanese-like domain-containing protein [Shewanella avicenniae]|uniref:Rhodanese-like domain-containing protein n=1 Tax=Shewanella avicenniae TaxID=2814294 RepID=A0ABX7QSL1_9GAMM|nr:rhodanese-like domain-containing protein [Shewanella avicenniae]QSX33915.1 rhodanese-like domain-containing protein [Shewanella avicenniae]